MEPCGTPKLKTCLWNSTPFTKTQRWRTFRYDSNEFSDDSNKGLRMFYFEENKPWLFHLGNLIGYLWRDFAGKENLRFPWTPILSAGLSLAQHSSQIIHDFKQETRWDEHTKVKTIQYLQMSQLPLGNQNYQREKESRQLYNVGKRARGR